MQEKNFEGLVRGDYRGIDFTLPGNLEGYQFIFSCKYDKEEISDIIIQKKNDVAGGSDSQILVAYNASKNNTKVTVLLDAVDVQGLLALTIYYDLTSQNGDAPSTTPFIGSITFVEDINSPYSGTDLPEDGKRYIPVVVPSTVTQAAIEDAITKKHLHENSLVLNATEESFTTELKTDYDDAVSKEHTHSNKSTLDTYTQTETDLSSAVSSKHIHANSSVLAATQESLTTALKTDYDDAVSKEHAHSNKSTLDTYTQTEADLSSAVSSKHTHANKSVLDVITQTHLDSIAREDALYNYLFNGIMDENSTSLSLDENNMILQLDEGIK